MPLVEIVPAPWTRAEIPLQTKAIMTEIGQTPVVFSREIDGFALNRIQYVIFLKYELSISNLLLFINVYIFIKKKKEINIRLDMQF